ncbi:hypothetical protein N0V88_007950 [Collariella sp. IMI 366227]|nr:hypothetical protein N0V88_007950 [Collariella sp. IMI 366227]
MATALNPVLEPHPHQRPHSIHSYAGLARPPHLSRLESASHKQGYVEPLSIDVDDTKDGFVPGFLHLPPDFITAPPTTATGRPQVTVPPHHHRTAAILMSGAGGGVAGPSSMYLSLACKLATLGSGIPTLRLDYRYPAHTMPCVNDAKAGMKYLRDMYGLDHFVLVGWSFGGAVVFTVAGDHDEKKEVVGCATIASQTAGTEGIGKLAARHVPVMLMHGSGDNTLGVGCSQRLWHEYGDGDRMLQVFEGDNHSLSQNAEEAEEMLCEFVAKCAGVRVGKEERQNVVGVELLEGDERRELMEKGGDLRAPERED